MITAANYLPDEHGLANTVAYVETVIQPAHTQEYVHFPIFGIDEDWLSDEGLDESSEDDEGDGGGGDDENDDDDGDDGDDDGDDGDYDDEELFIEDMSLWGGGAWIPLPNTAPTKVTLYRSGISELNLYCSCPASASSSSHSSSPPPPPWSSSASSSSSSSPWYDGKEVEDDDDDDDEEDYDDDDCADDAVAIVNDEEENRSFDDLEMFYAKRAASEKERKHERENRDCTLSKWIMAPGRRTIFASPF
ncbi:hypothetical protein PAAG_04688 [Paracoccidioides lutzii Pb01]|uniref:Uncharacterized protein n=1 Tax=Paracoccidioides lutzii (strain ATCC MYA-826 / Pb01) TaxID=502779 RepID=C1H258_PARBA|nr:hypothetical protein PAAG_04688 [Paracoccidioides lutzii Pb01]EEH33638.2 hypothetical protein PAAG_04688 [Paracoccidioides lutzii Pb01]